MSFRPFTLLSSLLVLGLAVGYWLSQKLAVEAPSLVALPTAKESAEAVIVSTRSSVDSLSKQLTNMQSMVDYLQGQVKALTDENAALKKKLTEKAGMEAKEAMSPKQDKDDEAPDFRGIALEIIQTRQLKMLPADTVNVERKEVEKRISEWLVTQFPADYGKGQGRAFAALGAIPQPVDTIALKAAFLSYQLGGWFDVASEKLYLAEPAAADAEKENALALAYSSIYREFGGGLFLPMPLPPLTTDARLARECLIGGDASLTRLLHALENPKKGGGGGVGEDPDDPSRAVPIPNFLRELELLPFNTGREFAQTLHSAGQFDQLNGAYERPPVAGMEIIDPGLYLDEMPLEIPAIKFPDVKVQGQKPIWDDTLGALALVLYLKQHAAEPIPVETASGWANDRLLVYAAEGKPRDHVAWQSLWKDSNAADAYFAAMRQGLLGRYKGATVAEAPKGVFRLNGPVRFVSLQRTNDGRGVLYIDAAEASFADAMLKKLTELSP
jgi:hypothetical protein